MATSPPRSWTRFHTILAMLTLGFVWSSACRPEWVESLCHEGQVVELLTAFCYAIAAVLFATAKRPGSAAASAWLWMLAVLCGLVAAEEVSWGQSLFHWQTPAAIDRLNLQGETNLHNLAGLHGIVRLIGLIVVMGIVFVVPWLAVRLPAIGDRLDGQCASASVGMTTLVGVGIMAGTRLLVGEPVFEIDEWAECVLAFAFLEYGLDVHGQNLQFSAPMQPAGGTR